MHIEFTLHTTLNNFKETSNEFALYACQYMEYK